MDLEGSVGQRPDDSFWIVSLKRLGEVAPASENHLIRDAGNSGGHWAVAGLVPQAPWAREPPRVLVQECCQLLFESSSV